MISSRIMGALSNCLTEKELQMKEKQVYEKEKTEGKFREKAWKLLKVTLCLLFMVTVFTVPGISAKAADPFSVTPYKKEYDGGAHWAFDVWNASGGPINRDNYNVWYKKSNETDYKMLYTNTYPTVRNVSDSATYNIIITNTNITTAEQAEVEGNQLYKTSVTARVTAASLSKATASISGDLSVEYNGEKHIPTVKVKFNGSTLTEGTDYKMVWNKNNTSYSELVDAGTYSLRVEPGSNGNFTGAIANNTITFIIDPI